MQHSYEITTLGQFLFKVVHHFADHGFYYYVFWELPEARDLKKIDQKIAIRYGADQPRWKRFQDRQKGRVVVRYCRYDRHALLITTEGKREESLFFERERWDDLRVNPIRIWKYSIGVYQEKGELRLRKETIRSAERVLERVALEPDGSAQKYLNGISPFTYPGIIRQKKKLVRNVNKRRHEAGLKPLTVWQPAYRKNQHK